MPALHGHFYLNKIPQCMSDIVRSDQPNIKIDVKENDKQFWQQERSVENMNDF